MLKIGVFGAGHLGKIHIRLLKELTNHFELVGFYDPSETTAKEVEAQFQLKAYSNPTDLIKQVDCIDIVTPTPSHVAIARIGLNAGKHVFIEKPITQTIQEAEEIVDLAEKNACIVQVGHVERFNPAFKAALPYFDQPMFIETHRLAQFNPRGTDVPVVLDLMIHDIDIILSVVKSAVKSISASGVAVVSESDDITNVRIEFENACVANLTSSRISLKNMRKSRFFQKDAYISVDFLNKEMEMFRLEEIEGEQDPFDIVFDTGSGKPKKRVLFDKPEIHDSNAIKEELIDFSNAIVNKQEPTVTMYDGLNALKVAIQILKVVEDAKLSI